MSAKVAVKVACPSCRSKRIVEVAKTYAYYPLEEVDEDGTTYRGLLDTSRTAASDEEEVFWACDECGEEHDEIREFIDRPA